MDPRNDFAREQLAEAFRQSSYLHSCGSGDYQSMDLLLAAVPHSVAPDEFLAGGIMAMAMIGYGEALSYASAIVEYEPEVMCDWCGQPGTGDEPLRYADFRSECQMHDTCIHEWEEWKS